MRRFALVVQILVAVVLLGATPAPAMHRPSQGGEHSHGPARAPALTVVRGTLRWGSLPRIRSYLVAAVAGRRTTYRIVDRTRFTPSSRPGHTVGYMVRARARNARWSRMVRLRWSPLGRASQDGDDLKVSVENTTGWGVDTIFHDAGLRYERLDVGDGSDLDLVAKALRDGITPLVLYNPGPPDSLSEGSPAQAAAQIVSLAQRLASLAARYPILNKLRAIEFGNEVYIDEDVTKYAVQYDAAHRALSSHGLGSWKLLADATAVCGVYRAQNWIPDFIGDMSAGAGEVDGWAVHPYGSMTTDSSRDCAGPHGYGWPDVRDWHRIAVTHGSNAPWYVTEVGQCISAGTACPEVISPDAQAADMTRYLDAAESEYPWVVYFNWYTSCDDSTGGYGLLAENSDRVCGADGASDQRPAFDALARWIAANGEG